MKDVGHGEKEVSLFGILKAVGAAEAQFIGDTDDTEGLAGEAAAGVP